MKIFEVISFFNNVLKHTIEHEVQTLSGIYELTFSITGDSTASLKTDFSLKK